MVVNSSRHLARIVLVAFALTFILARLIVFLIMAHWIPDIYIHLGGTHIHHLNIGIFLLAGTGAYMLFMHPAEFQRTNPAVFFGIGLALTFDEFGMWLHLGGDYWQRASFDAVVVIAGILGLIILAPSLKQFKERHWMISVALAAAVIAFGIMLRNSFNYVGHRFAPRLQGLEMSAPQ